MGKFGRENACSRAGKATLKSRQPRVNERGVGSKAVTGIYNVLK